jgi:hypothetical protein
MARLVPVAALMRNPAIFNPALAGTLSDEAAIDPDMMMTAIGPITRGPDVSVARRWGNDDSRSGWGNFDVNNGRLGQ